MTALEEVLAQHRPDPVFSCECTPVDDVSGIKESLGTSWEAHVAAAVTAWITERLASEDVREAVEFQIHMLEGGSPDPSVGEYATAALTAVTDALREGAS